MKKKTEGKVKKPKMMFGEVFEYTFKQKAWFWEILEENFE